jgi:hypothetical protein
MKIAALLADLEVIRLDCINPSRGAILAANPATS